MAGSKKVQNSFNKLLRDQRLKAEMGIKQAANILLTESNRRVPIDKGLLKASGMIGKVSWKLYEVTYKADYAIYVHEDLNAFHPNGEAKFLFNAMVAKRIEILKTINEALKI